MDALIISKWLTNWAGRESKAPSIIAQMINNVLRGGEVLETPLLKETALEQTVLINTLLLVCLLCVPTMLFVKPWILNKR
jgi:antibiotic biosynthesis monooxygenase (ABM) superfamily enzyme